MCNTGELADLRIKKYPQPRPTTVGGSLNIDSNSIESQARGDLPQLPERIIIRIIGVRAMYKNTNIINERANCFIDNRIMKIGIVNVCISQNIRKYLICV